MTKTFYFSFYDGYTISVVVPINRNCVQSNEFMPDFIKEFPFGLTIALQAIDEFQADCNNIVNEINMNRWKYNIDSTYYYALKIIVEKHISKYGRLFFSDLTGYADVCCHLMRGFGFDANRLKSEVYLVLIQLILQEFKDYIKDGNPMVGVVPFTTTHKYNILLQNFKF